MSDPDTSGAKATEPAETTNAATSGDSQPNFTFGTSRGSGLARGKRNGPAAPAAASTPSPVGYTPTAIEMINPKSEYQNPFAPVEQPAPVPVAPIEAKQPEAPKPVAAAPAPVAPAPKPVVAAPAPVVEPKAELKILPPTEIKHPAQSWESPASAGRSADSTAPRRQHEERPTFRPEGRQRRDAQDGHAPRDPREMRDPRAPRDSREPRAPRSPESFTPRTEDQPVKSGGFIGWLKGLFGAKPEDPKPSETHGRDDQRQPRRNNRGGRGRGRNFNGPRGENSSGRGSDQGQSQGDRPRRRSRGGRNRNRGGDRDGPRSGGQQGGGAI
ncbi:MAG: hypothetical protein K9N01_05920 [Cephaloticoccus sp.]|nr:hypothetical protein [Cephaloticoccus sp.]